EDDSAGIFNWKPSEARRDGRLSQPPRRPERVGQRSGPEEVESSSTIARAAATARATAQLPLELALELEAQLEQKQREFYDSLGGYSTVDEEDDELHELLAADKAVRDTKRSATDSTAARPAARGSWTSPVTVIKEEFESADATAASAANPKAKTLGSPEELVDTEPEDDDVDLRDSDPFDGYSTFDEDEEEVRDLFIDDHEFDGLCAPPSASEPTELKAATDGLEAKPEVIRDEVEPEQEEDVEEKQEVAASKLIEIDLNEEELLTAAPLIEQQDEMQNSLMAQTLLPAERVQALQPKQLADVEAIQPAEEPVDTESEEEMEILEVMEVEEVVEVMEEVTMEVTEVEVEEFVLVEEYEEELLPPVDEGMLAQTKTLKCPATPGVYCPGLVDEYACSIYENLRAREERYHVTEDVFAKQTSVRPKMRSVLVDWLVEVHQRFELEPQTLYLTVNYVDRFLAHTPVKSQRFQLVGVAALLIASKFEEIYPCDMDDLLYICERSYSKTDLIQCERDMLNAFKFSLAVPSVTSFLGYFLHHVEEDELIGQLANYFSERTLLSFAFGAAYRPSLVAATCLLAAYCYAENQTPSLVWNSRLVELTGFSVEELLPCARGLWLTLAEASDLAAVTTKYSAQEFGEVALLPMDDLELLLC
ncbi:hypothetical protein BBJ28_00011190, partial [Nothophytophthora sp. Chile5]